MSSRLLVLTGLMACIGAGCQDQEGAKLTLSFPNFKPGCIRVNVKDAQGAGSELTKDLQESLATKTPGGQLNVAVLFQEGWGERLTFTGTAYEQRCGEGPEFIVSKTAEVAGQGAVTAVELTFDAVDRDGDGYVSRASGGGDCADDRADVHPGQKELCNGRDDNCDDRVDEGFELVGQQCGAVGSCQTWVCNAEGGASCQTGPTRWYRDQDGDGQGTPQDSRESCLQPKGYVNNNRDCDDTRANVYFGAPELCDSVDNDCDNSVDENFNVGTACNTVNDCAGITQCASLTATECKSTKTPTQYYVDDDQDGYGGGTGPLTCSTPRGYTTQGGDCRDGNPFIRPNAAELCDGEDNDCNAATDEGGACPTGGGSWKDYSTASTDVWRSVALYGNGGVGVTGGDKLHLRKPGQSSFQDISSCVTGGDMYGIAFDPGTGEFLLGGNDGFIARYDLGGGTCPTQGKQPIDLSTRGVHVVLDGPGRSTFERHLVGLNTTVGAVGRALRMTDTADKGYDNEIIAHRLADVHGLSSGTLFAVGGADTPESARIYRFNTDTKNWEEETVPGGGVLRSVWVVSPKLAYAVGRSGTLLTWNGTAWSKVTGGPTEDLNSVVAFGTQSIYVGTLLGRVHYYNGTTWRELFRAPSALQFLDIAANSPGDIWVVGTQGARYHWPQ